jgi:hypothetical protein
MRHTSYSNYKSHQYQTVHVLFETQKQTAYFIFITTHQFIPKQTKVFITEPSHTAYRQSLSLAFLQYASIIAQFLHFIKFQVFGIQLLL